jgi:hypothetical protein
MVEPSQTTVILPLDKPDFNYEKIEELLKGIEPETILFLSKLKEFRVKTDTGFEIIVIKDDTKAPLIQVLIEEKDKDRSFSYLKEYLLYTKTFSKPSEINAENRRDVETRDVSIAFPLGKDSHPGKVYAYLPVQENTGLPFLINADFLLTSSREGIKEKEPWNKWLLNCVSETFVTAFEQWLDLDQFSLQLYKYIPLNSHINFLQPVVQDIHRSMRERKIIITEPDGIKRIPEQTRIAQQEFRALLTGKIYPQTLLDIRLVASEIETYRKQLEILGVKQLGLDVIKKCLQDREWIKQHDRDWLVECYRYLSKQNFTDDLIYCPIVPIEAEAGPKWSCEREQRIYFECDDKCKLILDEVPDCARVNVKLAFLDREFYKKVKDDKKLLDWIAEALWVFDFSARSYAVDVLSWLKSNYGNIEDSDLVATTDFLCRLPDDIDDFSGIPILLDDGRRLKLAEIEALTNVQAVAVPQIFDPDTGWQRIWRIENEREHFVALSNLYAARTIERFVKEGLIDKYPLPKRVFEKYTRQSVTKVFVDFLPPSTLESSAKALMRWLRQMAGKKSEWPIHKHLFQGQRDIDVEWGLSKTYYTQDDEPYRVKTGTYQFRCEESSFLQKLKAEPWLPSTKGPVRPGEAFRPLPHIKEIFGDTVPYFEGDLPDNMLKLLGIKTVTVNELVSVLEERSKGGTGSFEFAERVYRHLNSYDRTTLDPFIHRLKTNRLIFVPESPDKSWVSCRDAIWKDRGDVLGKEFVYLENIYSKLRDFFVNILGVKPDVDQEAYANRWLRLQTEGANTEKVENLLSVIYRELRHICEMDQAGKPLWWPGFLNKAKVWTQGKVFMSPQSVYVPDDGDLKKIFKSSGIAFAWRPKQDSFSDWKSLYNVLKVKYVSESVDIHFSGGTGFEPKSKPNYLTNSAKILIGTHIRETHPEGYNRIVIEGILNSFLMLAETQAEDLKVAYNLDGHKIETVCASFWVKSNNKILVVDGSPDRIKNEMAITIARGLMPYRPYRELAGNIERFLGASDWQYRVEKEGWGVPPEIQAWINNLNSENFATDSADTEAHVDGRKEVRTDENLIKTPDDSGKDQLESAQVYPPKENTNQLDTLDQRGSTPADTGLSLGRGTSGYARPKAGINFRSEMKKAFNRSGIMTLRHDPVDIRGIVFDLERRRDREAEIHLLDKMEEPDPADRRRRTERNLLEPRDEIVRTYFEEWYNGKCQICGKTFPERSDGRPYFVAGYIVPRKLARECDKQANALCLCADHFVKWQLGAVEADDFVAQVERLKLKSKGGEGNLPVRIKLCGEECSITFHEKHLLSLQELLAVSDHYAEDDIEEDQNRQGKD